VTGTDTGVGKTVLSALLVAALDGIYWKPVQTGAIEARTALGASVGCVPGGKTPAGALLFRPTRIAAPGGARSRSSNRPRLV